MTNRAISPVEAPDGPRAHSAEHLEVVAFHEAGHIVATTMRGGATFHGVDLAPTDGWDGITYMSVHEWDMPFTSFAGPWAEARAQWGDRPLDAEDDQGITFHDYVSGAFLFGGHDDFADMNRYDYLPLNPPAGWPGGPEAWEQLRKGREDQWYRELEREWPAIQAVAAHLIQHRMLTPHDLERIIASTEDSEL